MNRSLALTLFLGWSFAGVPTFAGPPQTEVAAKAWAITDAVLAHHVDPPTRQQMILAGIKSVSRAGHDSTPVQIARRVSDLTSDDQLASLLAEVWAKSKLIDAEERDQVFFAGMLSVVPGGASLLSAKERKVNESFAANLYVGIQVALGLDDKAKKPVLIKILEGGPADLASLKSGDLIEAVDGVSAEGMPLAKVIDRLRGEVGTVVQVKCLRPETGLVFEKPLTRSRLPQPTIEGLEKHPENGWKIRLDGPSPIGYLKITSISGSTPFELRNFAGQLEAGGAKALILDLRQVQATGLHETILLADALLDGGTIGRVASADDERIIKAEPDELFRGWPIVVLTNEISTGEAAWLVDALTANKRATLIGPNRVMNDPLVQEMVALPGGEWSVQMATGRLEQGDGSPLALDGREELLAQQDNLMPNVARKLKEPRETARASVAALPPSDQNSLPGRFVEPRNLAFEFQMAQARAILGEALKSARK